MERARGNPDRFNEVILGRDHDDGHGNRGYWSRQREIARSFVEWPATYVHTGNMVGKSHVDSGLILSYLYGHPNALVLATAPSQTQLEEVLWKEVERAFRGAHVPLPGRLLKSPLKIDLGGGWQALAYSTSKIERLSGHHGKHVAAILDEASGIEPEIWDAIAGVNPARLLATGNPLWAHGTFFERCRATSSLSNVIRISSLESPHIHLQRSPWGLADATWLETSRNDYGEASLWWMTHVLGLFPDSGVESVIPTAWLDQAGKATHYPKGPKRLAIDLGEGREGDPSVIGIRDDNGIIDWASSNRWSFEQTATNAALKCQRWGVLPHHVSWDVGGIGADFANRLEAAGIMGARPYRGGADSGSPKFVRKRSLGAWRFRQRLDPNRMVILDRGATVPQTQFAIRPDILTMLRKELVNLQYTQDERGRIVLESKEEYQARLKHSPNNADVAGQLFAFSD